MTSVARLSAIYRIYEWIDLDLGGCGAAGLFCHIGFVSQPEALQKGIWGLQSISCRLPTAIYP